MSERSSRRYSDVSVGNWFGSLILLAIPVVGLIMLIVWAVSSKRPSKRNFAIAALIWLVVFTLLTVGLVTFFGDRIVQSLDDFDVQRMLRRGNILIATETSPEPTSASESPEEVPAAEPTASVAWSELVPEPSQAASTES